MELLSRVRCYIDHASMIDIVLLSRLHSSMKVYYMRDEDDQYVSRYSWKEVTHRNRKITLFQSHGSYVFTKIDPFKKNDRDKVADLYHTGLDGTCNHEFTTMVINHRGRDVTIECHLDHRRTYISKRISDTRYSGRHRGRYIDHLLINNECITVTHCDIYVTVTSSKTMYYIREDGTESGKLTPNMKITLDIIQPVL